MLLIVGLGNPGSSYKDTRHNIGFIAADILSDRYNLIWLQKSKFNADIAVGDCELGKIILCKPDTFMNLSGSAVQSLSSFYKIPKENIVVMHDDLDLPLGKIKYKIGGGAGGHNGLKSIDNAIGPDYHRLRIGIGRPEHKSYDIADYVLGKFTKDEESLLAKKLQALFKNFNLFASGDMEKFKSMINQLV